MAMLDKTMEKVMWWTLVCMSGYYQRVSAEVLVEYKYFLIGERESVTLPAPAVNKGTEFIWEWTSHDGSYTNAPIVTIPSRGKITWNLRKLSFIETKRRYDISLKAEFQNAGIFTFIQTKPERINLSQVEVFAVELKPFKWLEAAEGSDVIRSCTVSHLPDSASLIWYRDKGPTANTTLIYNKTAHIAILSADQHSVGTYHCVLQLNREHTFRIFNELQVREGTFDTNHILYRGGTNTSNVRLICHSFNSYSHAAWYWAPSPGISPISVASAIKNERASLPSEIDGKRFSSKVYDGKNFPLEISPVNFGDSGWYTCYSDGHVMAKVSLVTVNVSADPPGGVSRNQSVELRCEISKVFGSVTLAWLRMKGPRGELVKQEELKEHRPERMLSLMLPSLSEGRLHWACVVFTGGELKAKVPLHLNLPPRPIIDPKKAQPGNRSLLVIALACTAALCVGLFLLGALFFRLKRGRDPTALPPGGCPGAPTVHTHVADLQKDRVGGSVDSTEAGAVYSNIAELQNDQVDHVRAPTEVKESESELQYLAFTAATHNSDHHGQQRRQLNLQSEENDKVVYASIVTK